MGVAAAASQRGAVYELVGKATANGNVTLYQVLSLLDGKLYNINRVTMLRASASGMVTNVRVQNYNGVDILRGKDININELRPINPKRYEEARRRGRTVREALSDARKRITQEEREAKARKQAQQPQQARTRPGGYNPYGNR